MNISEEDLEKLIQNKQFKY